MNNYRQQQQGPLASTPNRTDCHHRWFLDDASAPMSRGRCRLCGEERTFLKNPDAVTAGVSFTGSLRR
jgi:hypothetical protein